MAGRGARGWGLPLWGAPLYSKSNLKPDSPSLLFKYCSRMQSAFTQTPSLIHPGSSVYLLVLRCGAKGTQIGILSLARLQSGAGGDRASPLWLCTHKEDTRVLREIHVNEVGWTEVDLSGSGNVFQVRECLR